MLDVSSLPSYPVLPLRDIVVFPAHDRAAVRRPRKVGRGARNRDEGRQADPSRGAKERLPGRPGAEGHPFRRRGRLNVLQLLKLPDGTVKVLVEGGARARIVEFRENPAFFEARAEKMEEDEGDAGELEALSRSVSEPVRAVCEAQQEGAAGSSGLGQPDRGAEQARGHDRLGPPLDQARREVKSCWRSARSAAGWSA